jgi:hypothetical protein
MFYLPYINLAKQENAIVEITQESTGLLVK